MNATLSFREEALLAISRLPSKATARRGCPRARAPAALRESDEVSARGKVVPHAEVIRRCHAWHRR
jgi:hypothetical protein